jgi:hypothetical protein
MGYFDALASTSFKTTDDGRRLFFPLGAFGRGYVVSSEEDFARLRKGVKIYLIVSLLLIIGSIPFMGPLGGLILLPFLVVPYALWAYAQCRNLERTDERLTVNEALVGQALQHSKFGLWSLEVCSVLFVVAGIFILAADPKNWLVGLASIVFFGFCTVMIGRMLMVKRRQGYRPL